MPFKNMHVDVKKDAKDMQYVPKDNVFDQMNWEICKYFSSTSRGLVSLEADNWWAADDPELWKNQPLTVQIVRPQHSDEELISMAESMDQICNA